MTTCLVEQYDALLQLNIHRQRLTTTEKKVLDDGDKTLVEFGIKSGDKVEIKDLGPQICESSMVYTSACSLLTQLCGERSLENCCK